MSSSHQMKSTGRGKPNFATLEEGDNLSKRKYIAGMVLSGVGDALGYKNGEWEMCRSGEKIQRELIALGGLDNVTVKPPEWIVSDDTVMHLATADALIKHGSNSDNAQLYLLLATEYKKSMDNMNNRMVGVTCQTVCKTLDPQKPQGYRTPFNERGGGCGAAMRAMCIGLRFPRKSEIQQLMVVSIEAGRITHHHPTGYLGSLASALFVSYAVQGKPIREWGAGLLEILPTAKSYIQTCDTGFENENIREWSYFEEKLLEYLRIRGISDGKTEPRFPKMFDIVKRDQFYTYFSFEGIGGNSGYDAPLIAYDAILGCNGNWHELCERAMFHGGDSDSTGVIAGCLFGVLYGFEKVPEVNYKRIEYYRKLDDTAAKLFDLVVK